MWPFKIIPNGIKKKVQISVTFTWNLHRQWKGGVHEVHQPAAVDTEECKGTASEKETSKHKHFQQLLSVTMGVESEPGFSAPAVQAASNT